jgi:hypothetical protein
MGHLSYFTVARTCIKRREITHKKKETQYTRETIDHSNTINNHDESGISTHDNENT